MPFPPINLHTRISSPGRDLFRRKKANLVPSHSILSNKTGEEKDSDKDKLSMSWSAANLRNLGRKPQQPKTKLPAQRPVTGQDSEVKSSWLSIPKPRDSCDSITRSSSLESTTHRGSKQSSRSSLGKEEAEGEIQFSLSLTPEAILVIQKRNLEKQMMAKQQRCCTSADFRHRRVFPSKRAQGGSKSSAPVAKLEGSEDITTIVKISLLNDQYKYDDVEYEDEDGDVDETVVRKCKEWLKGVESAAAFGKVEKLASLPHLKGC